MEKKTVYLKAERNTKIHSSRVFLKDVAKVQCSDKKIEGQIKNIKVYDFEKKNNKKCALSIIEVICLIERICSNVDVQNIGETDFIVEWVKEKKESHWLKVAFVSAVSFFGASFTIMAFHNDIGIRGVFSQVYKAIMEEEATGLTVLEISYSIGLFLGIIIFFNHLFGKRIQNDLTPTEVAMRTYEEETDRAYIATMEREETNGDLS